MLDPVDRFFAPSGEIFPGGPSIWHVVDWDQRRLVAVKMDEELESEDPAFEHLLKHIDNLPEDVYMIHVSPQGELLSTSNDPKEDRTRCVYHPPLDMVQRPDHVQVVSRGDLKELDRLGPNVDLVVNPLSSEPTKKLVFKYYFLFQHLSFVWHEMGPWMRLPKHPNIVPFDRVVVDEVEGRVVGFTVEYIPGGTLEENKTRVFKLKWLHQLIDVVDELNLNLGIAHQDIAPRNLLVRESTDAIQLFDFNYSSRIGEPDLSEARNDIKGVMFTMYEIITRDEDLRSVPHEDQDISAIEQQEEWVKHPDVLLDSPVAEFRNILAKWSERRRAAKQLTTYTDAPNFVDWPNTPDPIPLDVEMLTMSGEPVKQTLMVYDWARKDLRAEGKHFLNWERTPRSKLGKNLDGHSAVNKT